MSSDSQQFESPAPQPQLQQTTPAASDEQSNAKSKTKLGEVLELAESLDPNDRTRLIAAVWESLPERNRTALKLWLDSVPHVAKLTPARSMVTTFPAGPKLWDLLFDRDQTSGLYSAPRRFDLATIFVVTAAYSLLFGGMALLGGYFGTVTQVAIGAFVTIVAACQAAYWHAANPRGVSVVSGAIALTVILIVVSAVNNVFGRVPLIAILFYGTVGGVFFGYLAGTMVGGVFLVADVLRKKFVLPEEHQGDAADSDREPGSADQSPWTELRNE